MIYLVRLHRYPDDTTAITSKQELKNLTTKQYFDFVKEVFIENQMNYGQDAQKALDAFSSQPFGNVEKWLIKSGFDLENDFKYLSGGK